MSLACEIHQLLQSLNDFINVNGITDKKIGLEEKHYLLDSHVGIE